MITGTPKFMTISSCCQKWTTDLGHHLPTKSVVEPTCGINLQGPTHLQGLHFYDFSLILLIFTLVWTHKNGVFGQKWVQKFSSNRKIGGPWGLWHFSSNYTGTSWLYMANCRVFEIFESIQKKSSIYSAFFGLILKYSLWLLRYQNQKKMSKNAKSMNYTLFYLLICFFRFLMSFFTRFSDLYLTRFGNLDFQSSLAVPTDGSLGL